MGDPVINERIVSGCDHVAADEANREENYRENYRELKQALLEPTSGSIDRG
jgi:hypothetical protein